MERGRGPHPKGSREHSLMRLCLGGLPHSKLPSPLLLSREASWLGKLPACRKALLPVLSTGSQWPQASSEPQPSLLSQKAELLARSCRVAQL